MMYFLNVIGGSRGIYLVASWVQMAGKPLDGPALSSCVPALKPQNHRDAQPVQLIVKALQTLL